MNPPAENVAEIFDELTAGWELRQIQDIAEVNPRIDKKAIPDDIEVSFVPMPAVEAESGAIDVAQTRLAKEVKKGFTAFLQGDILFAKITPCMENGKMAIAPALVNGYGFGSTEFHVLRPRDGIDAKYLYYYVSSKSFRGEAERFMTGAVGQKRVSTTYIKEAAIPLAPIDDQRRIVAEIEKQFSRLDIAIANLKRVKANLKRYKAAVLKAAVEGKLTEEWRKQNPDVEPASKLLERILAERRKKWEEAELAKMKAKGKEPKNDKWKEKYQEPQGPKMGVAAEYPYGWELYRTDQLFYFVTSGSRGWAKYYSERGPIFLRVGNLDHGSISLDMADIQNVAPPDGAEGLRTRVQEDDILISITADVGMVAVIPQQFGEGYINQHISLARPVSQIQSEYLAWFLAAKPGQDQFKALQRGATKAGLGLADIRSVEIPMPPVREQTAIVREIEARISVVEKVEEEIAARFKQADWLRQSLLQRAFGGTFGGFAVDDSVGSSVEPEHEDADVAKGSAGIQETLVIQRAPDDTVISMNDLTEVLRQASGPLSPEKLFVDAGYSTETIDDFYAALRRAVDIDRSIEELRPNDTDVLLKLVR